MVISGRGIDHYWKDRNPPTLVDPSPMYNALYRFMLVGVRIPVPVTHFGWRPFQRAWRENGGKPPVFKRDPFKHERDAVLDLYLQKAIA